MPRPKVDCLTDAIEDYKRMRRGAYSDTTWQQRVRVLETWAEWMYDQTQPLVYLIDIDERHMVRYFDRLRPPKYSPATFNNYRQSLCLFWNYCREESWIGHNPMRHLAALKVPRVVRQQVGAESMLALMDEAEPRDRGALALGMNTALRSGDAVELRVGALDFDNDRLTAWIEKTDEEVVLPMTLDLRNEMIRWLSHYAATMGTVRSAMPSDWYLIPRRRVHQPVRGRSEKRIEYYPHRKPTHPERIVQEALTRLGLPIRKEGFHTLRRSVARVLYDQTVAAGIQDPIRVPQALLGHRSRRTTEIYLGVTHEKQMLDDMLRGRSFLTRTEREATVTELDVWRDQGNA